MNCSHFCLPAFSQTASPSKSISDILHFPECLWTRNLEVRYLSVGVKSSGDFNSRVRPWSEGKCERHKTARLMASSAVDFIWYDCYISTQNR